ncbi:branched-chain amino acid ABC transporter permease [Fusobacterium necrophorum]|uniref:Branched-chain amino acid ABC transporter permease n=1 Tax=Fusobacterium necrophorum TaxID=859 RepID=A0A4Q2KUQ4_9FUSO|nr:branched-chain amino acid ABC transporter permease [Fusobacterium necrophorum]RXZ68527.1 branched-chain amino acid ABC transporter permease [Fusobacterium necrophorum]
MEFLLQIINGLQIGSIYALISLGYTMVYGIAQLINFAHGDIIMVGAYISLFSIPIFQKMGFPIWATIFPAMIMCALLGMLTEKIAYRPLRNSPRISNLITAIGVSLFLENIFMKLFTPNTRAFPKVFSHTSIQIFGVSFNYGSVVTILLTLALSIGLHFFMKSTKYGKAMLATSEDYGAATLVGINVNLTIQLTFAIGSALAAIASVLYVSAYPQVQPLMGSMLGIKAFIAAVLGGIGILPGAVIGGFILGIIESLTRAYLSSQLADAFVFGILIVALLVKPTGILGKNSKEKV